jgi:hypothetical protein
MYIRYYFKIEERRGSYYMYIQRIPENRKLPTLSACIILHMVVSTKFHYFKIIHPATPYIIIPPGGIIIYELAGGNILKQRNVVDPTYGQAEEG